MTQEIEFYSYIEDVESILNDLFSRGSIALTLIGNNATPSKAKSFQELQDLVNEGTNHFLISIPEVTIMEPVIDSVFNKPSQSVRYYFAHNIGGPFLEFDAPEKSLKEGVIMVKPGAFLRRTTCYTDRTYAQELPSDAIKTEFSNTAKQIKKAFSKYTTMPKRSWYLSPAISNDLNQGLVKLAGPLEGHPK